MRSAMPPTDAALAADRAGPEGTTPEAGRVDLAASYDPQYMKRALELVRADTGAGYGARPVRLTALVRKAWAGRI